jgi:hypothetical protein
MRSSMPRLLIQFDGDMEGQRLINLGAGTEAGDAVNKAQLDAGLADKVSAAQLVH